MKYGKRLFSHIKLFWVIFPVLFFILISFFSALLVLTTSFLTSELNSIPFKDLRNSSVFITALLENNSISLIQGIPQSTYDSLDYICKNADMDLTLYAPDGRIVFNSHSSDANVILQQKLPDSGEDISGYIDNLTPYYMIPYFHDNDTDGYIRVSVSGYYLETILSHIKNKFFLSGLFLLVITSLLVYLFFRFITNTVNDIQTAAINIVDGNSDPVMPSVLSAELSQLSDSLTFMANEIDSQKELLNGKNDDLLDFSMYDPLTGLGNKRRFEYFFSYQWGLCQRTQHPVSLILMDIDYFKYYNDTLGYKAGDSCLQKIGYVLAQTITRSADIFVRLGGEQFAVLLPETEYENALALAEKILLEIAEAKIPHPDSPVSRFVSLSLGIHSTVPKEGIKKEVLYEVADQALYKAKHEGRNRIGILI